MNSLKNTDSFVKWKNVKYVSVLSRRRPEKVTLLGTAVSLLELNFSACYNIRKAVIKCSAGKRDTVVEILIVEDDPNIARTIEVTISLVGYECRICGDGAPLCRRCWSTITIWFCWTSCCPGWMALSDSKNPKQGHAGNLFNSAAGCDG